MGGSTLEMPSSSTIGKAKDWTEWVALVEERIRQEKQAA
jgi:hypothetical protein